VGQPGKFQGRKPADITPSAGLAGVAVKFEARSLPRSPAGMKSQRDEFLSHGQDHIVMTNRFRTGCLSVSARLPYPRWLCNLKPLNDSHSGNRPDG
jgi:hypothetical protein